VSPKIIYHSDDIGATRAITQRILEAWHGGLLDGFSILANGDDLQSVQHGLRSAPDRPVRIAAHLNLVEGPALLSHARVPLLTTANGNFKHSFSSLLVSYVLGRRSVRRALREQVRLEWDAQIDRVRETCAPRDLSALDGHQHLHMLPFLFPVAASAARKHNIAEVRVTREPFYLSDSRRDSASAAFLLNIVKNLTLRSCSVPARRTLREQGLSSPDAMLGVLYSGRMSHGAVNAGVKATRRWRAEQVEVLLHIGRAAAEEAPRWTLHPGMDKFHDFYMSSMRDREYSTLRSLHSEDDV